MTLNDGRWDGKGSDGGTNSGTYTVTGNQLTFDWAGSILIFTFTEDITRDLRLTPVLPMNPGDVFIWSTEPWTKIQ